MRKSLSLGLGLTKGRKTTVSLAVGGGAARTDTSFLSGKTVQSLTTDHGAVGDGVTDNRTAILAALTWVKGANDRALYIPTGTFVYTGTLNSYTGLSAARTGTVIYGDGPQLSILKSTDNAGGTTVNGTGNRIILQSITSGIFRDFALIAPNNTARAGGAQASHGYGLNFNASTNNLVYNVWVLGVASGHMMFTAGAGASTGNLVRYCKVGSGGFYAGADGIHFTGTGSTNNIAEYCLADGCGDDSFASIGYGASTSSGNIFRYNIARNGTGGAGFSFEGANGGRCYGNTAESTYGPGLRISTKSGTATGGCDDVYAYNNTFTACNQGLVADNGTISMTASYYLLSNILLENNTITSPADSKGIWTSGTSGTNATTSSAMTIGVTANNNVMTGAGVTAFTTGTACTITKSGNTLNGSAA